MLPKGLAAGGRAIRALRHLGRVRIDTQRFPPGLELERVIGGGPSPIHNGAIVGEAFTTY